MSGRIKAYRNLREFDKDVSEFLAAVDVDYRPRPVASWLQKVPIPPLKVFAMSASAFFMAAVATGFGALAAAVDAATPGFFPFTDLAHTLPYTSSSAVGSFLLSMGPVMLRKWATRRANAAVAVVDLSAIPDAADLPTFPSDLRELSAMITRHIEDVTGIKGGLEDLMIGGQTKHSRALAEQWDVHLRVVPWVAAYNARLLTTRRATGAEYTALALAVFVHEHLHGRENCLNGSDLGTLEEGTVQIVGEALTRSLVRRLDLRDVEGYLTAMAPDFLPYRDIVSVVSELDNGLAALLGTSAWDLQIRTLKAESLSGFLDTIASELTQKYDQRTSDAQREGTATEIAAALRSVLESVSAVAPDDPSVENQQTVTPREGLQRVHAALAALRGAAPSVKPGCSLPASKGVAHSVSM